MSQLTRPSPNDPMIDRTVLDSWMDHVIAELRRGLADGQSPFAAGLFTAGGSVLATAHNTVRALHQPSRHAEVNAIDHACWALGTTDLAGHILVSTGEPCPMCTSIAAHANVDTIVFGAEAELIRQAGYATLRVSCQELLKRFGKKIHVIGGVRGTQCGELLRQNPKASETE